MTPLRTAAYRLIYLLRTPDHPNTDAAVVDLWDMARTNPANDDESLVSLAMSLADRVTDVRHFGAKADEAMLAVRCFVMADKALTDSF